VLRKKSTRAQCPADYRAAEPIGCGTSRPVGSTVNHVRSCGHGPVPFARSVRTVLRIACDLLQLISETAQSHAQLAAENLFLRKQLALYAERPVKPRRADDATRITLVALSWLIEWRRILTVVKPDTLIRWHRKDISHIDLSFTTTTAFIPTVSTVRSRRWV
jgi:hypothetical protein